MRRALFLTALFACPFLWAVSVNLNVTGGLSSSDNVFISSITVSNTATFLGSTITFSPHGIINGLKTDNSTTTYTGFNTFIGSSTFSGILSPSTITGASVLNQSTGTSSGFNTFLGSTTLNWTTINSTVTTNAVITSSITVSHLLLLPRDAAPRTNVTPIFASQLILNTTANEVCFSTGVVPTSWVKISTPSQACSN